MPLWASLSGLVQRVFAHRATTMVALLGSGDAQDAIPGYPTLNSMSSVSRFPWIRVCVDAVAGDMAGLPLVAVRRAPGGSKKRGRELTDDPILGLLERPSPTVSGFLFRKQLVTDLRLTGNAYLYRPSPNLLYRLHPGDVTPQGSGFEVVGFKWWNRAKGQHEVLPPYSPSTETGVIHARDVSWTDDASSFLGESPIRCLHDNLMIELGAKKLAAQQAQKGKPDILLSVKEHAGLGADKIKELKDRWRDTTLSNDGAFVTGGEVQGTILSWAPNLFGFNERSIETRDVTLSVLGVPPSRAGLSSANYGTQKQQSRTYWEALRTLSQLVNDALSLMASAGVKIEHDFQDVEALQVSYTERIAQIGALSALGATPKAAADYVGLDDAPLPDETPAGFTRPQNIDKRPEEPQGDKSLRLVEV
jgi:phage portal protein BeeE